MDWETFETPRLRFRPLAESDLDDVHRMMSDPEVMKHSPHDPFTPERTREWFQERHQKFQGSAFGFRAVVDKDSGQYLGHAGLLPQDVEGETLLEVGYWFLRSSWGHGYAIEAARAFRDSGFRDHGRDKIVSLIVPENQPSQKVALRNGMRHVRDAHWKNLDIRVYEISREEWENHASPP